MIILGNQTKEVKRIFIISLWLLLILVCFSCSKKKELVKYYEDGSIESKVELKGVKRHGMSYYYYPDGTLEIISSWKEGLQDGVTEFYYPNGQLESRTVWKDGDPNGLSEEYYANGQLKSKAFKKNGKIVGSITINDQEGFPVERQFYNEYGKLVYVNSFNEDGSKSGWPIPLFRDERDPVPLGEMFVTTVSFGFKMKGKLLMLVGHLDKMNNLTDTVAIFEPTKEGSFVFATKANKPGENALSMKFIHETDEGDTLSVNDLSVKHPYFVKEEK
jgi:hypothetical protein